MILFSLAIGVGLVFLVLSADRFVAGSAAIANNFGVPHIIIGVTIVSLGTSAPEIIAAIIAAMQGRNEIALGNAIGSNIANIGLVLGVTALIAPLPVNRRLVTHENLIMIGVVGVAGLILYDRYLSFIEGLILIAIMVVFLAWIYGQNKSNKSQASELSEDIPNDMSTGIALISFVAGLAVLIVSARVLLWGAVGIADAYGVSEAIVGATIIAIGTSLPELAASVASALKKHHDIAIGNVIGSNIFNLLPVLAMPGLIAPAAFLDEVFQRDYLFMALLSLLLCSALVIQGLRGKTIGRYIGTVFVLSYGLYGFIALQSVLNS